jgi:Glycosyl transferase family 2
MGPTFSLVYPTRHRPEFIRQALQILEHQRSDDFEVVVCDNPVDPVLSCEQVCRDSGLANLRYVRPPRPLGMVENWNHALPHANGEYVAYFTDKMFVLPDALGGVAQAIDAAGRPDIVSWTSDAYNPASTGDNLGAGTYVPVSPDVREGRFHRYAPASELDRRGEARVSRTEQTASQYSRGKIVFGAYRRDLVSRIVDRYSGLFRNINPDYTSMVLGLTEARDAIEMTSSCVVSVNTDLSNGWLSDTNDAAALAFLESLAGGAAGVLPELLVPGVYVSLHNWVAHDYLTLQRTFDMAFQFDPVNWLVYCHEDVHRSGRVWSDPRVEDEQKERLRDHLGALEPRIARNVEARLRDRAGRHRAGRAVRRLARPVAGRLRGSQGTPPTAPPATYPSIQAAMEHADAMPEGAAKS